MVPGRMKIGDFSRLAQVSVRTLRLYDELGLLKPEAVDKFSDYRYYNVSQLPRIQQILTLKDMGLSLEQIDGLLKRALPGDQLQVLLQVKQTELEQELVAAQERLTRVRERLLASERGADAVPPQIQIKAVEGLRVVSTRRVVKHVSHMQTEREAGWHTLLQAMGRLGLVSLEPELVLYHSNEFTEENIDTEFARTVGRDAQAHDDTPVTVRTLPAEPVVASLLHTGHLRDVTQSIIALFQWMGDNGYESAGPIRELHHFWREYDNVSWNNVTLELQIPVRGVE